MLVQERPMQGNQSLPLLVSQLVCGLLSLLIDLDAFLVDHHQTSSIHALHLIDQLVQGRWVWA